MNDFDRQKQDGFVLALLVLVLLAAVLLAGIWLYQLDQFVRQSFEQHRWVLPAKVYARPMELYEGATISADELRNELDRLHYQVGDIRRAGHWLDQNGALLVHVRGFVFPDATVPEQVLRLTFSSCCITHMVSTVPGEDVVRLDPMIIGSLYPRQNEDRILMRLGDAPPGLVNALLATEDRDFYHHHGVSIRGTMRAFWVDLLHGQLRQGGSTLTQQLVKNFYLSDARTLGRKLREMAMAVLLELHYSKQEILQAYLNEVNLGQAGQHSIHGFALAAQYYFGQPVRDLNLDQVATLVGMVKGPSLYDPRLHPRLALSRRNVVLANMMHEHMIEPKQFTELKLQPLRVLRHPNASGSLFPAFVDVVRMQLQQEYRDQDLANEGLRIFTTLDPRAQLAADDAMHQVVDQLRHTSRARHGLEGSVLVSNPQNGELLALVGSADTVYTGFNHALLSARPVGSLLKPAIDLTALSSHHWTLASTLDNTPLTLTDHGQVWQPHNDEAGAPQEVTLEDALAHSWNLANIRLGMAVGLPAVITTLHQLGVDANIPVLPSILLGAISLTPWQVLNMYQSIAAQGFRQPVHAIRAVVDSQNRTLVRNDSDTLQVANTSAVYLLQHAMHAVMTSGTAAAAGLALPAQTDMAGKTGTTNALRDSWFAGFTGNRLAVVWVGRDDDKPMGLAGAQGALPVWIRLMKELHPAPVPWPQPEDVQWAWVNPQQQTLSGEHCPDARYLPFFQDTLPTRMDSCTSAPADAATASGVVHHVLDTLKGLF